MTVELSENLVEDVMSLSGARSKKDALRVALEDYVSRKRIDTLLALPGTMEIDYVRPEMEEAELAELRPFLSGSEEATAVEDTPLPGQARVAERRGRYR